MPNNPTSLAYKNSYNVGCFETARRQENPQHTNVCEHFHDPADAKQPYISRI
ncbi:MAG: hypothetical protein IJZ49_04575 [Alistipes sp.]|nr:hypothetical protein [Alistipes sp.]